MISDQAATTSLQYIESTDRHFTRRKRRGTDWFVQDANDSLYVISPSWEENFTEQRLELTKITLDECFEIDAENALFLNQNLHELHDEIESSKYIIDYEEEDEETGEITKYHKQTWVRAIRFITQFADWSYRKFDLIIPTPKIFDGPKGGIDIYWKKENFKLLINFPESLDKVPVFYGDDFGLQKIKGSIDENKQLKKINSVLLSFID